MIQYYKNTYVFSCHDGQLHIQPHCQDYEPVNIDPEQLITELKNLITLPGYSIQNIQCIPGDQFLIPCHTIQSYQNNYKKLAITTLLYWEKWIVEPPCAVEYQIKTPDHPQPIIRQLRPLKQIDQHEKNKYSDTAELCCTHKGSGWIIANPTTSICDNLKQFIYPYCYTNLLNALNIPNCITVSCRYDQHDKHLY